MSEKDDRVFRSKKEIWMEYFPNATREEHMNDAITEPKAYGTRLANEIVELVRKELPS